MDTKELNKNKGQTFTSSACQNISNESKVKRKKKSLVWINGKDMARYERKNDLILNKIVLFRGSFLL